MPVQLDRDTDGGDAAHQELDEHAPGTGIKVGEHGVAEDKRSGGADPAGGLLYVTRRLLDPACWVTWRCPPIVSKREAVEQGRVRALSRPVTARRRRGRYSAAAAAAVVVLAR